MGITVNHNKQSLHLQNGLRANARHIDDNMKKIATGSKIPGAKDNPAAYEILVRMNSYIQGLDQSNQNTQTGNAMLATANGAIGSSVDALSSLKEKLLSAANGTNNESDISAIQDEVDQLVSQINDNASVNFNGKSLIDGSLSGNGALQIAGVDGGDRISIDDMSAEGLGLTSNGESNIDLSTPEGISDALDLVDSALNKALSEQSKIGASQTALGYSSSNYTSAAENLTNAASTIGDADIGLEMMKLTQNRTLEKLKLFMMAQSNQSHANVLGLLR